MSELSDCRQQSAAGKRSASPDPGRASPPAKAARAADASGALAPGRCGSEGDNTSVRKEPKELGETQTHGENGRAPITTNKTTGLSESGDAQPSTSNSSGDGPCTSSNRDAQPQTSDEAGAGSAIVMGPRQSAPPEQSDWAAMVAAEALASLTRVQARLEALDRKAARLHQRLELKLSQQRRPHLEQRSAIIRTIPGFWVTALLNHPLLSAHIDENDEEALSSMSHLEGPRCPSPTPSFGTVGRTSQPKADRGRRAPASSAGSMTTVTRILKDDLYRNPLRYYLTPLWEPQQNGSEHRGADHSSSNECVVISDSEEDEEEEESGPGREEEEEADTGSGDSEDGEQREDNSSDREREEGEEEELDVEELDEEQEAHSSEVKGQEEEDDEEEGEGKA
ncbi:hypothetical protein JZ751_021761 [Albula glossodonta]|uniref:Uncharacterized protein n=1 Tax=Albula glossodonta TaxID=121402 RepID=A0A8T2NJW4_9TELE|nr:hypothetical protein JZ751_021761 [Albula glossodonta]